MGSLLGTYHHLRSSWIVKCNLGVSKGLTSVGWLSEGHFVLYHTRSRDQTGKVIQITFGRVAGLKSLASH